MLEFFSRMLTYPSAFWIIWWDTVTALPLQLTSHRGPSLGLRPRAIHPMPLMPEDDRWSIWGSPSTFTNVSSFSSFGTAFLSWLSGSISQLGSDSSTDLPSWGSYTWARRWVHSFLFLDMVALLSVKTLSSHSSVISPQGPPPEDWDRGKPYAPQPMGTI